MTAVAFVDLLLAVADVGRSLDAVCSKSDLVGSTKIILKNYTKLHKNKNYVTTLKIQLLSLLQYIVQSVFKKKNYTKLHKNKKYVTTLKIQLLSYIKEQFCI